jgi:SAM-dependent methyltransferase
LSKFDTFFREYSFWEETCSPYRYHEVFGYLPTNRGAVLDAGCGSGVLVKRLSRFFPQVVGVDLSIPLLSQPFAKSYLSDEFHADFVNANLETLPFKPGSFDLITSYGVLHHTHLDLSLPILKELLRSHGRIVISDFVAPSGALHTKPIWQIWRAFRSARGYVRDFGWKTMFRIVRFRISPNWLQHVCSDKLLNREDFPKIYGQHFPGAQIKISRWSAVVFWEKQP